MRNNFINYFTKCSIVLHVLNNTGDESKPLMVELGSNIRIIFLYKKSLQNIDNDMFIKILYCRQRKQDPFPESKRYI